MADSCHWPQLGWKRIVSTKAETLRHHSAEGRPMNMLQHLVSQTPTWVWLLLAFLVTRGIAAMKPG